MQNNMNMNRQVVLASFAQGAAREEDFAMTTTSIPVPKEGEFLIRNLYFSLEPAIRGWIDGKANYFPPIPLGGVIRGPSIGRVMQSHHATIETGNLVFALNHWEDYSLCDSRALLLERIKPQGNTPISYYAGPLGGAGATAYVGLHEIGHIQSGQTVVVSAAAGATGSMAGQIAKQRGCRVIGIVGSDKKAHLIINDLGFDAAINYTTEDVTLAAQALAPEGTDIYFDNVGGPVLNAMLPAMKVRGRIVGCGMISDYNRSENPNPITNLWEVVARQLTMQGFLLFDYQDKVTHAHTQINQWIHQGKIRVHEHITQGIVNAPRAFCELMAGKTTGKALVEIDMIENTALRRHADVEHHR